MSTITHVDLRGVIDRFLTVQDRRDPVELAQFHAIDGTVESPMYGTLVGRPAIEDAYRAFFTSFPDATFHVEDIVIEPPDIAVFSTVTATHVNEFFGLPGTNRRIDFRGSRLFRMNGDLIARDRRIYDFTGILVQVGVLRAKPAK
jgi:predicted ester cyclase